MSSESHQQRHGFAPPRAVSSQAMLQPINLLFKHWQQKTPICLALYDNTSFRIHGTLIGFDEYMNLVLDDACEVQYKKGRPLAHSAPVPLGRILLKGENISMLTDVV
eukprot:ANDGO_06769.mRNA.1 putative small nuclear ribonucleoprotein E